MAKKEIVKRAGSKEIKPKLPKGELKNVKFSNAEKSCLTLKIGDEEWSISAKKGDVIFDEITRLGITPEGFKQPDMHVLEFEGYCKQVLALSYQKIPVDIWEDMPAASKSKWKTYLNKIRKLPETATLTGIKPGDIDAALKLMPKEPS